MPRRERTLHICVIAYEAVAKHARDARTLERDKVILAKVARVQVTRVEVQRREMFVCRGSDGLPRRLTPVLRMVC